MTKPPDAPTVTRPAWALALHHVTLGIDDVRISPWSEVADETLAVLIPWLALACANDEPVPLPAGLEHHTAVGIPHGSGLVMTVYGSMLSENPPLVTFGVAQVADKFAGSDGPARRSSLVDQRAVRNAPLL